MIICLGCYRCVFALGGGVNQDFLSSFLQVLTVSIWNLELLTYIFSTVWKFVLLYLLEVESVEIVRQI